MFQEFQKYCILATFELLEEADVVLGEEAEVLYTVLEVGNTLYTQTEGIARIYLRINAARLQYVRVHHTATQNLYPACAFAERTTLATAEVTRDIHLSGWFGEWEIAWTEANLCLRTKHLFCKV